MSKTLNKYTSSLLHIYLVFPDLTTLEDPTSSQANEISDAVAVVESSDEDRPDEV